MASRRGNAETAAREKADRMKAYLEEKYERLKKDKEEEKGRRESLEETMVSPIWPDDTYGRGEVPICAVLSLCLSNNINSTKWI